MYFTERVEYRSGILNKMVLGGLPKQAVGALRELAADAAQVLRALSMTAR